MEQPKAIGRKCGRLTVEAVVELDGEPAYDCSCRCGGRRIVLRTSFINKSVTCCEECVKNGLAENLLTTPPRFSVSVDADSMALLGYDLKDVNGVVIRQLLREFGRLVKESNRLPIGEPDWQRMLKVVQSKPHLLEMEPNVGPAARLNRIVADDDFLKDVVTGFDSVQVLTVLSALRWGLANPDCEWWRPEVRIGEAE